MLRELKRNTRASSMLESLLKAPKGLDEMLRHVLETFSRRLNNEEAANLNTILAWVTCAETPLSLTHLDEILKLASPAGDSMLGLEAALRTQYASSFLLYPRVIFTTADSEDPDIDSEDNSHASKTLRETPVLNPQPDDIKVVFCHASIGDYLRNPSYGKVRGENDSVGVSVDIIQARVDTLKLCLQSIVLMEPFNADYKGSTIRNYVIFGWLNHLRHVANIVHLVNRQARQDIIMLLCKLLMCMDLEAFDEYGSPPYFFSQTHQ